MFIFVKIFMVSRLEHFAPVFMFVFTEYKRYFSTQVTVQLRSISIKELSLRRVRPFDCNTTKNINDSFKLIRRYGDLTQLV